MDDFARFVWPRPHQYSDFDLERFRQDDADLDKRINDLSGIAAEHLPSYLEAVRRIVDDEAKRKISIETRATTFIVALATLFPLMTWALVNTDRSICSEGWGCLAWTAVFVIAVIYFITAAYWSLKSLAVASYHVVGVEDIVCIHERKQDIFIELIRSGLLQARKNRDTINEKLVCIKIAQRRFFNGLAVLGFLLMFDPLSRFGVLRFVESKIEALPIVSAFKSASCPSSQLFPVGAKWGLPRTWE